MNDTMYNIDYTRTLPPTLKNDETMLALARVIADELQETVRLSRLNIIYARIDELDEELLDILAYDLHVDWYEYDSPVDVKRELIKGSVKVHKVLGTKYAVERVISAHFGNAVVREWFEYGGRPYRFKIMSCNPGITNERIRQFLYILETIKRKSAWLDGILITLTGDMELFSGVCFRDVTTETHEIHPKLPDMLSGETNVFAGTTHHETTLETHVVTPSQKNMLTGKTITFTGIARHDTTTETHAINSKITNLFYGTVYHETNRETHKTEERTD